MFRHLNLKPKTPINPSSPSLLSLSSFSSSSSSSSSSSPTDDPPPPHQISSNESSSQSQSQSQSQSPPSYSSFFTEIKERLKSPQPPPRRIPTNPPPPSAFSAAANPRPAASLEEIRKHLAEFRLKSGESLKKDVFGKPSSKSEGLPFDSIRESLSKFRASSPSSGFNIKAFQDGVRRPQLIGTDKLPDSIFGKEKREKKGEGEEGEEKAVKTEFLKMYGYEELGEKLRGLRPAKYDDEKGEFFSLAELNERLGKLRELEEKETELKMGGVSFRDLRESLQRLKDSNAVKKANSE